ncbi:hypothetical protein N7540_005752 [Penicillium herquei]|nr:hypothetical protein N7540_005752 [Penicillium herquei]
MACITRGVLFKIGCIASSALDRAADIETKRGYATGGKPRHNRGDQRAKGNWRGNSFMLKQQQVEKAEKVEKKELTERANHVPVML